MRNQNGETLIEVIVSIVILGMIFGVVAQMIIALKDSQNRSKQQNNMITRIEETIERFTIDPMQFNETSWDDLVKVETIDTITTYHLYCDRLFNISKEEKPTSNYLEIEITNTSPFMKINILVYIKGSLYEFDALPIERTIMVG